MKRLSLELRRGHLRLALLAMARAHASEHSLSARSAVKEVQAAATLLDTFDLSNDERPSTKNPLIPAYKAHPPGGALVIQFRRPACQSIHSHGLPDQGAVPPQHRVSHCELGSYETRGYRLLVVGWECGEDLPTCSSAEIDAFNGVICESGT